MPPVTLRNTKAEIMAAHDAMVASMQSGPTWGQVASKLTRAVSTVSSEIVALGLDLMHGWRVTRACYNQVMAELTRPIFKA